MRKIEKIRSNISIDISPVTMIGPTSDDTEYFFYYLHSKWMPESWFVGTRKYLLEEDPVPKTKQTSVLHLHDFHMFLFLTLYKLAYLRGIE